MNPKQAMANRTARLVREGVHLDRVAYTSETPQPREHLYAIEVETGCGRYWLHVLDSEVDETIATLAPSYEVDDIDHSAKCWCQ